jgi:oligoribonuclease NrnB/cAMP/cGMP phosphodiesterase (DHH superfamily)
MKKFTEEQKDILKNYGVPVFDENIADKICESGKENVRKIINENKCSKTSLITHTDPDGFMCAGIFQYSISRFVFNKYLNNSNIEFNKIIYADYNQEIDLSQFNFQFGDLLIVADYSLTAKQFNELFLMGVNVLWFDHHESTVENIKLELLNKDIVYFDNDKSGCKLLWDFACEIDPNITNNRMDCLIQRLSDYDSWVWLRKNFVNGDTICSSHDGFATLDKEEYVDMFYDEKYDLNFIENTGNVVNKYRKKERKEHIDNFGFIKKVVINEKIYKIGFVNMFRTGSVIIEDFKNKFPVEDINIVIIFIDTGNVMKCSIYNNDGEIDCSLLAKNFGGGGHKGAAGFVLSYEKWNELTNGEKND